MRPSQRIVRPVVLCLLFLSCATDSAVGPKTPMRGNADVGLATSELIITEIMPDPSRVADTNGEWFEVYNPGMEPLDLRGLKIVSASGLNASESHTIATSVVVEPGEYVVLGNNANTATNGNVFEAYSYGGSISLNNGSSSSANEWLAVRRLTIVSPTRTDSMTLDSVAYAVRPPLVPPAVFAPAPGPYTPPSGSSRALLDLAADNFLISGLAWTTSATPYGAGDRGTPGQPNTGGPPDTVTVRVSWVTPGTTFRVTASAVDVDGKPSATNFAWSSNATSIATVDPATGVATGVSLGIATLTATASNGVSGSAPLFVVNAGDIASISISINDPARVPAGFTKPAFPTTKTTAGETVKPPLVWSSSDDAIASVSDLGYVTGNAPGTVRIRATSPNGVYGEVSFAVEPASAATSAVYRNHVDFGTPTDNTPDDEIILSKPQYVASYNKSRGGPNWVSWNIDSTHFGEAPRCDCFSADQSLPADAYHVVDYDYRDGKYDRGHMVQSESRTTTDQENAATFLLTNILPQGGENNQGPWSKFENYLNDLARGTPSDRTMHEIYVIAGGEYAAVPGTLKDEGKVAIPDYTWKIAVVMDRGKGLADVHSLADLRVIAVKMPNLITPGVAASAVGIRNNPWEQYQTTVRELENETHYDFLSALPDNIELLVETNDRPPVAAWNAPIGGREGSPVTFDGSASSDPDAGDALTYAWDFGDGSTVTGGSPTHTYADNGSYSVTLTVRDPAGAEDTQTKVVTISNEPPVVTSLTVRPSVISGETVHALASFTDAGIADNPWSYAFTWGSGMSEVGSTADQSMSLGSDAAFFQAGTYTVTLTVTDKDGARSTLRSATFSVLPISVPMSVSPDQINIRNQGEGEIVVTLLGSREIAASSIDEHSIRIGTRGVDAKGNGAPKGALEDVNGDGFQDLVLHFSRSALVGERLLTSETRELVLHANLIDHREIEARGKVRIITKQ